MAYKSLEEYSWKDLNWANAGFLVMSPVIAIAGLIWWFWSASANWNTAILALVIVSLAEISITAGYHRLFSHRAYDANFIVKIVFLIFGAAALQGSALMWSLDHRNHHRYVDDNEKDPYSINRGFWWAHMLWLFFKANDQVETVKAPDLYKDKLVMLQDKCWVFVGFAAGFFLPMYLGSLWGDMWGGLLIAGVLRSVVNHHSTFLINSLSHCVGDQTYSNTHTARDNWFTALLTFGEGYHNFHHEFPSDYRNGVRFYHFDPTKWLIRGLSFIGFTYNLKRVEASLIKTKREHMTTLRRAG